MEAVQQDRVSLSPGVTQQQQQLLQRAATA